MSDLLIGEPTWFNATTACQSLVPWKTRANKTAKVKTGSEGDDPPATDDLSSKAGEITKTVSDSHYVGNYTHSFFGNVRIHTDCAESQMCFHYGRYGWMSLAPASKTVFKGRFYGPLSFMNPGEVSVIYIVFTLNDSEQATSLALRSFFDADVIHFERQELNASPVLDRNGQESIQRAGPVLTLILITLYCLSVLSKGVI